MKHQEGIEMIKLTSRVVRALAVYLGIVALVACGGGGGGGGGGGSSTPTEEMVGVPNVLGDTQAAATTAIADAGLAVGTVTTQTSTTVPSGDVISESPVASTNVASGSSVGIVVSSGSGSSGGSSAIDEWAWEAGSNSPNAISVYGTVGTAAANNAPGARIGAASWTDSAGNLWLFGGSPPLAASGSTPALNDLWKYSPSSGLWTWMGGSDQIGALGVYGTIGVASPGNAPGARYNATSWIDSTGNLWLFGGSGCDSTGCSFVGLNDLWQYSPSTGEWTWVSGSSVANASGVYGPQGVASAANVPGARNGANSWIDPSGNVWLFGGIGFATGSSSGYLNDLWKYTPSTGQWTWMTGSTAASSGGSYGSLGVAAPGNVPGARSAAASWVDAGGNLWLFGGLNSNGVTNGVANSESLNDLWRYIPGTNTWTWMGGSNVPNSSGVYGTLGVAATTNVPGARNYAAAWTDQAGNFWLFGGELSVNTATSLFNDLWEYNPSIGQWTWIDGANTASGAAGVYGTLGTASAGNIPGARSGAATWTDNLGNLWLFGGNINSYVSDLWSFNLAMAETTPPPGPPAAPTNLTATATSPSSVALSWTASTDTGGPGIGGYYVYRGTANPIATLPSTQSSYVDTTVAPSSTYQYTVAAFDLSTPPLLSSQSTAASVTTPAAGLACTQASGSPSGGLGWPSGQPISYNYSGDQASLTWGVNFDNPSLSSSAYTGSLVAYLWAVNFNYQGGPISNGYILATFTPDFVGAGAHSSNQIDNFYAFPNIQSTAPFTNPPSGSYCLVVTLEQFDSTQTYEIYDWATFSNVVTF
jgi:N-acetylneuraminic acid mutarotase